MYDKIHTLGVGQVCLWYPRGNKKENPRAALVTGPYPTAANGVLSLTVWTTGRGVGECFEGVSYIDDPRLAINANVAANNGAWDYSDTLESVEERVERKKKTERPRPWANLDSDALAGEIVKLFEEFGEGRAVDVAARVTLDTGRDHTHQKVNAIRREYLSKQVKAAAKG